MAKQGRPTVYDPKFHPQVVKWMARSGLTVEEIAAHLDVNKSTVTRWRNKYPDFCTAIKENREKADSEVEDSLLRRAMGYDYEEVKQVMDVDADGKPKIKKVEKTKKQVAPDVTAQIFWLKNRQPAKWRDKQEFNHRSTDGSMTPKETKITAVEINTDELSDDELKVLAAALDRAKEKGKQESEGDNQ